MICRYGLFAASPKLLPALGIPGVAVLHVGEDGGGIGKNGSRAQRPTV